jgi:hypothetical protein
VIGGSLLPDATPLKTAIDDSGISDVVRASRPVASSRSSPCCSSAEELPWELTIILPLSGVALEFAQRLVGRTFGIGDIAANTARVVCGWCAGLRAAPRLSRSTPSGATQCSESRNGSLQIEPPDLSWTR